MTAVDITGLVVLYLTVGMLTARVRAERRFDPENLGTRTTENGNKIDRTPLSAEDYWLGTGLLLAVFWPLVCAFLAAAGIIYGVGLLLNRALVPTQLRRMLNDRPS